MKRKSTVLAVSSLTTLAALAVSGCYASEKIGKDIQNVSHDVNQGGIYMHRGALSVYRPEPRPAQAPVLTNASLPASPPPAAPAAPAPAAAPTSAESIPTAPPVWQPPADGSEPLPKKDASPPAPAPAAAGDAGVYSM